MSPDVVGYASPRMDNATLMAHMQRMSMEQEAEITPDQALFSWIEGEETVITNDAPTLSNKMPQVQTNYNLHSKHRFTRNLVIQKPKASVEKLAEQPIVVSIFQKAKDFIPYKARDSKSYVPTILDIMEQLKKSPANASLWDILNIS